jgi:hypothetical protein
MKPKNFTLALIALFTSVLQAQNVTTVNAKNSDISDNLDLKAVASIFGDSKDLEDFERRLNDPKIQISNLDLNNDRNVDYLRVIESVESGTHLIVIQSVLEKDVFQDVATVEVEKDSNNNVQVQVVGDVYMYGPNYIYEPVYVHAPLICNTFWVGAYHPYYSPWYWNYYPVYYSYWNPYPVYRYRRNVHVHINVNNNYNYVNIRRSQRAVALHANRRADGYERLNPNRSFTERNTVANRYELDKTRITASNGGNRIARPATPRTTSENVRNSGRTNESNSRNNTAVQPTTRTTSRDKVSFDVNPIRTESAEVTISRTQREKVTSPSRINYQKTETPRVQVATKRENLQNVPSRAMSQKTETPRFVAPRQQERVQNIPDRASQKSETTSRTTSKRVNSRD